MPRQTFEFLVSKFGPLVGEQLPLGKLVMAQPENGCVNEGNPLNNAPAISGNIAVVRRGSCMFPDKVHRPPAPLTVATR